MTPGSCETRRAAPVRDLGDRLIDRAALGYNPPLSAGALSVVCVRLGTRHTPVPAVCPRTSLLSTRKERSWHICTSSSTTCSP